MIGGVFAVVAAKAEEKEILRKGYQLSERAKFINVIERSLG